MNFLSILPETILFSGSVFLLLFNSFFKNFSDKRVRLNIFISVFFTLLSLWFLHKNQINNEFFLSYSNMIASFPSLLYIKIILCSLLILVLIISLDFLLETRENNAEILGLIMIATSGSMLLISSSNLLSFYISLEMQTLPLYLLTALRKKSAYASEAALKYFLLGSVASIILLLGISLIYGFTSTIDIISLIDILYSQNLSIGILLAITLILISVLFKVSAAPFHMWMPDVYQGSANLITVFFATVIKLSLMIVLIHLSVLILSIWPQSRQIFIFVAILSLLVGSFAAIKQDNFKRMLAYSSISHVGFILVGLSAIKDDTSLYKIVIIYAVVYSIMSLGCFASLLLLKDTNKDDSSNYALYSLQGIGKTNPIIAVLISILMLSMAGIPPMAGFFTKFYVLILLVNSKLYILSIIALLVSVISAFYYLRVIKVMYFDQNIYKLKDNNAVSLIIFISSVMSLFLFLGLNNSILSI